MRQSALTILAPVPIGQLENKKADVKALGRILDAWQEAQEAGGRRETAQGSPDERVDSPARPLPGSGELRESIPVDSDFSAVLARYRAAEPALRRELAAIVDTQTVHYMGVFFLDLGCSNPGALSLGPGYVGLEVNGDGTLSELRERLATRAPTFLRDLFEGCEGMDSSSDATALQEFMARHSRRPNAYFVAFPGRTVDQIRREQRLRKDLRNRFAPPGRAQPPPTATAAGTSLREAPSSASAIWQRIRLGLPDADADYVRHGPARPWSVRWSLYKGGLRENLNLWGYRLFVTLAVLTASCWFATSLYSHGYALRAVALAFAIAGVFVVLAWAYERPRTLSTTGLWLVVRGAMSDWVTGAGLLATFVCAAALVTRVGMRLAPHVSHFQALVLVVAFFAAFWAFKQLGARASVSGALFLLLVDIAQWIPLAAVPILVVWMPIALLGLLFILAFAVLSYVMDGGAVTVIVFLGGASVIAAGEVALFLVLRPALPTLAGWGCAALALPFLVEGVRLAHWLWSVRRLEETENSLGRIPPVPTIRHLNEVEAREDRTLQNHLVVLSRLKDGPLRIRTLRRVLRGVSLLVKVYFNRGDLGGIRTIHFAQFTILEDVEPKRLLFLSNYDSAFGSYLQEFNQVLGVTAVWSNCVGFPPAFGLVGGGASDEQPFKQFGRRDQVPTLGWYSAYPRLFIRDIEVATETREDLSRPLDDPSTWWGRMRARFGRPLYESDCDAALQKL